MMKTDTFGMEERVIAQLTKALQKGPLEEFDILPKLESQNRSPVIQEGNCLGLEAWAVKSLFAYAYKLCNGYKSRWGKEGWKKMPLNDVAKLEAYTRTALLLMPDFLTFWNCRKELIFCGKMNGLQYDFQLTLLVVSRKPKCAEAFAHRRWLIKYLRQQDIPVDLKAELVLCNKAASQSPSNYHAWHHRQWSFDFLLVKENFDASLFNELLYMDSWCSAHVSDYSGLQFRQFLLFKARKCESTCLPYVLSYEMKSTIWDSCEKKDVICCCIKNDVFIGLLFTELQFVEELLNTYEGHEALWQHKQFVIENLLQADPSKENFIVFRSLFFYEKALVGEWKILLYQREVAWLETLRSKLDLWLIDRYRIWMNKFLFVI